MRDKGITSGGWKRNSISCVLNMVYSGLIHPIEESAIECVYALVCPNPAEKHWEKTTSLLCKSVWKLLFLCSREKRDAQRSERNEQQQKMFYNFVVSHCEAIRRRNRFGTFHVTPVVVVVVAVI